MASHLTRRASMAMAIAATAALALAGCSVDDKSIGGGTQAPTATSTSASVTLLGYDKKLAGLVPAAVREKPELVFGASDNAPYVERQSDGTFDGLTIDLLKQFESMLKLKISVQSVAFDASMPGIQAGRIDITGPAGDFVERQALVDFSDMAQSNVTVLLKKSGDFTPKTNDDLCGRTLGIQKGAGTQNVLDAVSAACQQGGKKAVDILTYQDLSQADLALRSGRVAAVVAPTAPNSLAAGASNGELSVVKIDDMQSLPAATATYGLQTAKGSGLAQALTAAMKRLEQKGVYKALFEKWGIPMSAIPADKLQVNGSTQMQKH